MYLCSFFRVGLSQLSQEKLDVFFPRVFPQSPQNKLSFLYKSLFFFFQNSIGVQRFVGDAKQTLEIRVERRGNRQGENRGEKSILINERLFAFFLHLYYYFKEPSGLDHE